MKETWKRHERDLKNENERRESWNGKGTEALGNIRKVEGQSLTAWYI